MAFIFQPAEENEGGARVMVEEGLFKQFPVDMIFALHNMPGVPVGTVKVRSGYISAAFDTVTITIEGQGGHGAMPETTKDPVPASSALVAALNTIVSRNIKPLDGAVVTIGEFGTGPSSFNVIPQKIEMKLSCRSLSEDVQQTLKRRILEICEGIGIAYDVSINCLYDERYPAVCNAVLPTKIALDALSNSQEDYTLITEFDPVMGSEDFAFMAREVPACYFLVGNGDTSGPLHSPTYNFDDAGLEVGASAWVTIAKAALRAKS
ncbi:MAG: amidohydrolase [Kordiimonadaceae bacterium]|nr:amidohydrolase [Kordiimonadaceae bacterium]